MHEEMRETGTLCLHESKGLHAGKNYHRVANVTAICNALHDAPNEKKGTAMLFDAFYSVMGRANPCVPRGYENGAPKPLRWEIGSRGE